MIFEPFLSLSYFISSTLLEMFTIFNLAFWRCLKLRKGGYLRYPCVFAKMIQFDSILDLFPFDNEGFDSQIMPNTVPNTSLELYLTCLSNSLYRSVWFWLYLVKLGRQHLLSQLYIIAEDVVRVRSQSSKPVRCRCESLASFLRGVQ